MLAAIREHTPKKLICAVVRLLKEERGGNFMSGQISMRRAMVEDAPAIASINAAVFLGDRDRPQGAEEWISCWLRAFPLYQYFIIQVDEAVVGYAGWQIHGGFHRAEPAIELDQIGIHNDYQRRGLAPQLIQYCIDKLVTWAMQTNDRIESHVTFVVWAYSLNFNAISIYARYFTDGVNGFRKQFGDRGESMLRVRVPIVRRVRD